MSYICIETNQNTVMKKMMFILAASTILAACGGAGETPASDSTVAPIDSAKLVTDEAPFNDAGAGGSSSAHEIPVK